MKIGTKLALALGAVAGAVVTAAVAGRTNSIDKYTQGEHELEELAHFKVYQKAAGPYDDSEVYYI